MYNKFSCWFRYNISSITEGVGWNGLTEEDIMDDFFWVDAFGRGILFILFLLPKFGELQFVYVRSVVSSHQLCSTFG
jgi:hypothetical protein